MNKFKEGDKVVISTMCKDKQYHGISGTVIDDLGIATGSDGRAYRVCLDKPVNNACVYWFADHELLDANVLVPITGEKVQNHN